MFIDISNVGKKYGVDGNYVTVLNSVTTQIEKGTICTILGPSGSGKSTFLNLIGGLDTVNEGKIIVDGQDITSLNSQRLSFYRRKYLGFVFQFYNLIPNLTVRENIQVCDYLANYPLNIDELIDKLGLKEHQSKFPSQLSGGQQQRCAIARALIKNPSILICDEPTGALDYKNSKEILVLLQEINKQYGTTILIVTHNTAIQDMSHKVIKIRDGSIHSEFVNETLVPAENITW